jgi:IMP dehydrogenase
MGYTGAHDLEDFRDNAVFVKISGAALSESHVHDVQITREPPNYRAS